MKWINIPEEAESGGLHVQGESVCVCVCVCVVCVCRQTALGDQSAQLLTASSSVSLLLSPPRTAVSSFDPSSILS